eukprot:GSChrysophyteH1.ASY1.ANO1.51.1 assembled CDS
MQYRILRRLSARCLSSGTESTSVKSRFWALTMNVETSRDGFFQSLESTDECARINTGFAFLPSRNQVFPVQYGRLQIQHSFHLDTSHDGGDKYNIGDHEKVVLCAFNNRASSHEEGHLVSQHRRPVDEVRYRLVKERLLEMEINPNELFEEGKSFAATPPARIYHSFIRPRNRAGAGAGAGADGSENSEEKAEKEAQRVALQISLALRQETADRNLLLRNVDGNALSGSNGNACALEGRFAPAAADAAATLPHNASIVLVCDNIRSAFNVGSLFRTCETAGISKIITCGITAHPPNPKLKKTAMGSEVMVNSSYEFDSLSAVNGLLRDGYIVYAMETMTNAVDYTTPGLFLKGVSSETNHIDITAPASEPSPASVARKIALVCGNEVVGIDSRILSIPDVIPICIPTYGYKNSLNVSSAVSIVLFEVIRQLQLSLDS